MSRWSYRRWDGSQTGFEDEIDNLFSELSDDLLYHGDPDAALRRLLNSGFRRPDGEQVQGLREMMERLRQQRQEELDRGDLGGAFDEIAQELEQVIAEERAGLEALADDARSSGDERRRQVTDEVVAERGLELELLPPDLAGRVKGLQQYDFTSSRGSGALRATHGTAARRSGPQLVRPDVRSPHQPRCPSSSSGSARCSMR